MKLTKHSPYESRDELRVLQNMFKVRVKSKPKPQILAASEPLVCQPIDQVLGQMNLTRNQILTNPRFRTQSGAVPDHPGALNPRNLLSAFYQLPSNQ
jgi:hypothetical protein